MQSIVHTDFMHIFASMIKGIEIPYSPKIGKGFSQVDAPESLQ